MRNLMWGGGGGGWVAIGSAKDRLGPLGSLVDLLEELSRRASCISLYLVVRWIFRVRLRLRVVLRGFFEFGRVWIGGIGWLFCGVWREMYIELICPCSKKSE